MAPTARSRAQGLADHFNVVLNKTVSHGRLSVVAHPGAPDEFNIICADNRALELHGCLLFLFISQRVEVDGAKVHTDLYSYRLQTDRDDRKAWIMRWEHYRQRPASNPYPLSHLHLNGELSHPAPSKALPKLHIPTGRLPFELVLWHLITEWGVDPISDGWQETLQSSLDGFAERRTR